MKKILVKNPRNLRTIFETYDIFHFGFIYR